MFVLRRFMLQPFLMHFIFIAIQFIWTEPSDKHLRWRDIILHSHLHVWSCSVLTSDWQHAGTISCFLSPEKKPLFCF